jgi:hypothetical protein
MKDFDKIKRALSLSSTLPIVSAGSQPILMGSTHIHSADGSCCGGGHHHHDDEEDTTNPRGGCC